MSRIGLALAVAIPCFGATLYDNGTPNNLGANALTDFMQADDFVLAAASDLTGVSFWSMELSPADYFGSIFWEVRNNAGGVPGAVVFGTGTVIPTRTAAGSALGLNIFRNDFSISIMGLAAGTYWLVLHNGPLTNTTFTDYYWAHTATGGGNSSTSRGVEQSLNPPIPGWTTNSEEHAFLISGDPVLIPEPGTLILISAGLGGLGLLRRRW
jgi:hypothetical protein